MSLPEHLQLIEFLMVVGILLGVLILIRLLFIKKG